MRSGRKSKDPVQDAPLVNEVEGEGVRQRATAGQVAFAKEYVRNGYNASAAVRAQGGKGHYAAVQGNRLLKAPVVRALIRKYMGERDVTPERFAGALDDALNATKIVGRGGKKIPDHGMRLRAVHMGLKLLDAYPGSGGEEGGRGGKHLHVHLDQMSNVQLQFLLTHGRYPTEVELKRLEAGDGDSAE